MMIAVGDGDAVVNTGHTQRDEERQSRFRTVGRGAKRIQPEYGNAGREPISLGAFFAGGEAAYRTADLLETCLLIVVGSQATWSGLLPIVFQSKTLQGC